MKTLVSSLRGTALLLQFQTTQRKTGLNRVHLSLHHSNTNSTLRYSTESSAAIPQSPGNQTRKVFVDYAIYKGKSALKIRPIKPVFKLLDNGGAAFLKEGSLFLEIAPATSQRVYDWNRKQVFALSITELGTLISLPADGSCEFYHDPNMGKSDAGMVRKVFKVEPTTDKTGYFFNLSISNKLDQFEGRLGIPVSKAEFNVMRSAISYIIPHLLGWHVFFDPFKLDSSMLSEDSNSNDVSVMRDSIQEWAK